MLNKNELLERLIKYDFSKRTIDDKVREHGFGNAMSIVQNLTEIVCSLGYMGPTDKMLLRKIYSFLSTCYSSINFDELSENIDEPAVLQLFKTRNLLVGLGFAVERFIDNCEISKKEEININKNTPGYEEIMYVTKDLIELDDHGNYRRRLIALSNS